MHADWIDWLDWPQIGWGVLIAILIPAISSLLLVSLGVLPLSWPVLILTQLSVLAGSICAAWRTVEATGRLINGASVALLCILISLVASVVANPLNSSNLAGIFFLFVTHLTMGLLGGLLVGLIQMWRGAV
ncbi:MAG: TIGR04086 family membrane protein [Ardenticatenaceae bacterium]|nr:TIGR04086 family membrane protein [Ardenticatenaceae bacterium]